LARKILLADDSVTAQNMGRKILTDAGYEVIAVNNGSAALKKIAEHKPDLIVLDVYMPGYSGLEVCQRIKENRETARIPVLLTVGKLEPFKPEEARRARADAFVVKPFEASELLTALTKLEDKIVPQADSYKPGRLAKVLAAIEEPSSGEKFGDADEGWKARLRFPSRKKQAPEAPEEIPASSTLGNKSFRDMQPLEAPAKPAEPAKAAAAAQASAEFERPIPGGLPNDITPEEIAAITAAAAQLSGALAPPAEATQKNVEERSPAPGTGDAVAESGVAKQLSEQPEQNAEISAGPATAAVTSAEVPVVEVAKSELSAASSAVEAVVLAMTVTEVADEPPMTFASAHGPNAEEATQAEAPPPPTSEISEATITAAQSEPPVEFKSSTEGVSKSVTDSTETKTPSAEAVIEPVIEPEPVPQESVSSPEPVAEVAQVPMPAAEMVVSAPAELPSSPLPEAEAPVLLQDIQLSSFETPSDPAKPADVIPETSSVPLASVPAPAEAPAQDEDVMAALQTLIPEPTPGAATISAIADEAKARATASSNELTYVGSSRAHGRWIAEEETLTAQEAANSLEQEMEKAYAAFAASEAAQLLASAALDAFPGTQPVVPVTAAAVIEPAAPAISEAAVVPVPEAASADTGDQSAASKDTSSNPASMASSTAAEEENKTSAALRAVPEPTIPVAAEEELIEPAQPPVAQSDIQIPETDLAGGMDDMGKNSEGFGFKMIRKSPAAGSKDTPKSEPARENFEPAPPAVAEPAAMAAAAAAESAPAAASSSMPAPTDPKAIASIVDSVLAELRPKIVEEIAKKLAGDGKKE